MGAAENDRFCGEATFADGVEVAVHNAAGHVAVGPAFFRQRNEQLTRKFTNIRIRIEIGHRLSVGAQSDGRLCRQNEMRAAGTRRRCGTRARLDDTNNRQRREPGPERRQRNGGGRIARNDKQLDALGDEQCGRLFCIPGNRDRTFGAVGQSSRISQIEQMFAGQKVPHRLENGQPADAGIKYADGLLRLDVHVAHCAEGGDGKHAEYATTIVE